MEHEPQRYNLPTFLDRADRSLFGMSFAEAPVVIGGAMLALLLVAALPGGLLLRGVVWLALTLAVLVLVLARPWGRSFGAWGRAAWRYRGMPARARWSPGKGERG
jgi:hypothetical protein